MAQCVLKELIYVNHFWSAYTDASINPHHHHVVPQARISLSFSRHFSLLFIASGKSSGLHSVSSHCCWMYVRAGRPAFARPYVGVHKSTSFMSSSLLLQQCPDMQGTAGEERSICTRRLWISLYCFCTAPLSWVSYLDRLGHLRWYNELQAKLANLPEWVQFLLDALS